MLKISEERETELCSGLMEPGGSVLKVPLQGVYSRSKETCYTYGQGQTE
jgi:hypothetical protein